MAQATTKTISSTETQRWYKQQSRQFHWLKHKNGTSNNKDDFIEWNSKTITSNNQDNFTDWNSKLVTSNNQDNFIDWNSKMVTINNQDNFIDWTTKTSTNNNQENFIDWNTKTSTINNQLIGKGNGSSNYQDYDIDCAWIAKIIVCDS